MKGAEGLAIKRLKPATRNTLLFAFPIVVALVCLGIGRLGISPGKVISSFYDIIFHGGESVEPMIYSTLMNVRLPRVLLALMAGAGLSVAGCAFQSVFSNALATPDTLGVSAGAAFGAAIGILMGASQFVIQLCGLVVGFLAVFLTYLISNRRGTISVIMAILGGIVISSLFEAGVSIIQYTADPYEKLPEITFWLMGSLMVTSYQSILVAAPFILGGIVLLFLLRWKLNVLTLSEDEARSMGVNIYRMRITVALAATMITAACVSVCGQIGWVGLLIPHIARMMFGSNNRDIVPASISLGAAFLVIIDTVARAATAAELPISILTALIGAPVFIALLRKTGGVRL